MAQYQHEPGERFVVTLNLDPVGQEVWSEAQATLAKDMALLTASDGKNRVGLTYAEEGAYDLWKKGVVSEALAAAVPGAHELRSVCYRGQAVTMKGCVHEWVEDGAVLHGLHILHKPPGQKGVHLWQSASQALEGALRAACFNIGSRCPAGRPGAGRGKLTASRSVSGGGRSEVLLGGSSLFPSEDWLLPATPVRLGGAGGGGGAAVPLLGDVGVGLHRCGNRGLFGGGAGGAHAWGAGASASHLVDAAMLGRDRGGGGGGGGAARAAVGEVPVAPGALRGGDGGGAVEAGTWGVVAPGGGGAAARLRPEGGEGAWLPAAGAWGWEGGASVGGASACGSGAVGAMDAGQGGATGARGGAGTAGEVAMGLGALQDAMPEGMDSVPTAGVWDASRLREALRRRKHLLCVGPAGCGKSHFLEHVLCPELRALYGAQYADTVLICASTGTSAVRVGGLTVHGALGLGLATGKPKDAANNMNQNARERWRRRKLVVVIDEAAVLSGYVLDFLWEVGRRVRAKVGLDMEGVQLIMLGDFLQLCPIAKGAVTRERQFLFQAHAWKDLQAAGLQCVVMKGSKRHATDVPFAKFLNRLSVGFVGVGEAVTLRGLQLREGEDLSAFTCLYLEKAPAAARNSKMLEKCMAEPLAHGERDDGVGVIGGKRARVKYNAWNRFGTEEDGEGEAASDGDGGGGGGGMRAAAQRCGVTQCRNGTSWQRPHSGWQWLAS